MPETSEIYCKSALFTCTCCGYATDIYSDMEWLGGTSDEACTNCKAEDVEHFVAGLIYREDLDNEGRKFPLHPQCASLPVALQACTTCINRTQIHWTEIVVCCNKCHTNPMVFTKYSIGKHLLLLYEQCVEAGKPCYEPMEWIDKTGYLFFDANGPGSHFSAS